MNPAIKNRTIRIFVSSILASDLSERDLNDLANDLIDGGDLPKRAGNLIKDILGGQSHSEKGLGGSHSEDFSSTGNALVDEALGVIKRRRLSKLRIINAIGTVTPHLKDSFIGQLETPLKQILFTFFKQVPAQKGFEFVEALEGRLKDEDQYLKGIMRGKRG